MLLYPPGKSRSAFKHLEVHCKVSFPRELMGKFKELWLLDVQENEVFLMDCNSFTDCRRFGDDTL